VVAAQDRDSLARNPDRAKTPEGVGFAAAGGFSTAQARRLGLRKIGIR
jgi:hypothetical protein